MRGVSICPRRFFDCTTGCARTDSYASTCSVEGLLARNQRQDVVLLEYHARLRDLISGKGGKHESTSSRFRAVLAIRIGVTGRIVFVAPLFGGKYNVWFLKHGPCLVCTCEHLPWSKSLFLEEEDDLHRNDYHHFGIPLLPWRRLLVGCLPLVMLLC